MRSKETSVYYRKSSHLPFDKEEKILLILQTVIHQGQTGTEENSAPVSSSLLLCTNTFLLKFYKLVDEIQGSEESMVMPNTVLYNSQHRISQDFCKPHISHFSKNFL